VADAERPTADQEQRGDRQGTRGLFDVQALQEVEHCERPEQDEREPERALPPAPEIRRRCEQEQRRGDRERVCDTQGLERLEPEKQVIAPGDVRCSGRGEVYEPRETG